MTWWIWVLLGAFIWFLMGWLSARATYFAVKSGRYNHEPEYHLDFLLPPIAMLITIFDRRFSLMEALGGTYPKKYHMERFLLIPKNKPDLQDEIKELEKEALK